MFVGYPPINKGYRLIQFAEYMILISRDVKFEETGFLFHQSSVSQYLRPHPISFPLSKSGSTDPDLLIFLEHVSFFSDQSFSGSNTNSSRASSASEHVDRDLRRSSRVKKIPTWMESYIFNMAHTEIFNVINQSVSHTFSCFLTSLTANTDPTLLSKLLNMLTGLKS